MTEKHHDELFRRSRNEPYARLLGMEVVEVGNGSARVRMTVKPDFGNVFGAPHGGALFSLIDEAFQLACNSHGILSVALNVSITYHAAAADGTLLEATAEEVDCTRRTSTYACSIREVETNRLIASAQALAYRTGKDIDSL